jgi:hypothetical protein
MVLIEATLRAQGVRTVKDGVLQAKPKYKVELPERAWSVLQVLFLLVIAICGFANMYIKGCEVLYQGPQVGVDEARKDAGDSPAPPPRPQQPTDRILTDRIDAVYFSMVTITTLGYGDFVPATTNARLVVMWQLGTGLLLLLGIFPLVMARIADF